jgi:hypothetical protein
MTGNIGMNKRNALAIACLIVAVFGVYLSYLLSHSHPDLVKFPVAVSLFNVIIIASILGYISPWRTIIVRLAVLDILAALVLTFLFTAQAPIRIGSFGIPNLASDPVVAKLGFALFVLSLIVKGYLSWEYADDLKKQGVRQSAGRLPIVFQIIAGFGGVLVAVFFVALLGFFPLPTNLASITLDGFMGAVVFVYLPLIIGLYGIYSGVRCLL